MFPDNANKETLERQVNHLKELCDEILEMMNGTGIFSYLEKVATRKKFNQYKKDIDDIIKNVDTMPQEEIKETALTLNYMVVDLLLQKEEIKERV